MVFVETPPRPVVGRVRDVAMAAAMGLHPGMVVESKRNGARYELVRQWESEEQCEFCFAYVEHPDSHWVCADDVEWCFDEVLRAGALVCVGYMQAFKSKPIRVSRGPSTDPPLPALLGSMLQLAVPMWIDRIRAWPPDEQARHREGLQEVINVKGAAICDPEVRRRDGVAAEAFNGVAAALAHLALCNGSVEWAGERFVVTPPPRSEPREPFRPLPPELDRLRPRAPGWTDEEIAADAE